MYAGEAFTNRNETGELWYAAPLSYMLNFGVFNDGQARIIHLSFAFLLAFTTFPARKKSTGIRT